MRRNQCPLYRIFLLKKEENKIKGPHEVLNEADTEMNRRQPKMLGQISNCQSPRDLMA